MFTAQVRGEVDVSRTVVAADAVEGPGLAGKRPVRPLVVEAQVLLGRAVEPGDADPGNHLLLPVRWEVVDSLTPVICPKWMLWKIRPPIFTPESDLLGDLLFVMAKVGALDQLCAEEFPGQ